MYAEAFILKFQKTGLHIDSAFFRFVHQSALRSARRSDRRRLWNVEGVLRSR